MWNKNIIAALLCSGLMVLAGCQKEDSDVPQTTPEEKAELTTYKVTISATKGVDTKALSLDGTTLNAYWKASDKVKVYKAGTYIGELSVVPEDGEKPTIATLSGDLTADGLAANDALTLLIPRGTWDYSGQTGVLTDATGSIESTYDYGLASVNIVAVAGNAVTTSGARFENQQSIYRFGFRYGATTIRTKTLLLTSDQNKLAKTVNAITGANTYFASDVPMTIELSTALTADQAAAHELIYVAIRNDNTTEKDTFSFTIYDADGATYKGSKEIPKVNLASPFVSAKTIPMDRLELSQYAAPATPVTPL